MVFILLLLIGLFGLTASYPCTKENQCNAVSINPKYAYCDLLVGECKCFTEQGFVGNATLESKCYCPQELEVFNDGGTRYCTTYQNGVAYLKEKELTDFIIRTEKFMYTKLIHPEPQLTLYDLIHNQYNAYLDLFTNDTKGRVSPVGTFHGLALVVEYYGGATYTGATRIISVKFNSVTAYNYTGTINVDLGFVVMDSNQSQVVRSYPLTQSGFDRYTIGRKIYSADKIIHNLDAAVKWVGTLNFSSPALHQQICFVLLSLSGCNAARDPLGYYHNMSDCTTHMFNRKAGSLGDTIIDADTVACSYFHMVYTRVDPDTHCAHAGKTGGGKCVVIPYINYYLEIQNLRD